MYVCKEAKSTQNYSFYKIYANVYIIYKYNS